MPCCSEALSAILSGFCPGWYNCITRGIFSAPGQPGAAQNMPIGLLHRTPCDPLGGCQDFPGGAYFDFFCTFFDSFLGGRLLPNVEKTPIWLL